MTLLSCSLSICVTQLMSWLIWRHILTYYDSVHNCYVNKNCLLHCYIEHDHPLLELAMHSAKHSITPSSQKAQQLRVLKLLIKARGHWWVVKNSQARSVAITSASTSNTRALYVGNDQSSYPTQYGATCINEASHVSNRYIHGLSFMFALQRVCVAHGSSYWR